MTGEQLEQFLQGRGVKKLDTADKLGMSLQNYCAIFKTKDIKTGMLERISSATGIPIPEFYGIATYSLVAGDGNTQVAGNNNMVNTEGFVALLSKKDEQIDRLLSIIENLSTN